MRNLHIRTPRKSAPANINKIIFLIIGSGLIAFILVIRLFNLQVLQHDYFDKIATQAQHGYTEIPAQRGEIIIKDYHSDEEFKLATNTTLNLLYADPALITDAALIADLLTPLIFDIEYERAADNERILESSRHLSQEMTEEEIQKILAPLTDDELKELFRQDLITKISQKTRPEIILAIDMESTDYKAIETLGLPGIEVIDNDVYAYPSQISDRQYAAEQLAPYLGIEVSRLKQILEGENRYVVIQQKLDPVISEQIEFLIEDNEELMKGLGLKGESFRYYPEGPLAANIIGYVNRENIGQYGIESTFNKQLQGVDGTFQTKRDSVGRQITVGESILTPAIDGDNIVLTIDRSVQLKVDQILEKAVKEYQADSGQVLIMNPQTGAIIAMSHYPTFDPNNYGDVFEKEEVTFTAEEKEKKLYDGPDEGLYYFYYNDVTLDKYLVFEEKNENGNVTYYRYKNLFGPEVYHNKIVSWPYEPGSVFKSIAMAIGLDDGSITPNTTYNDIGPIGVDFNVYTGEYDFEIKNAEGYYGLVSMQTVLSKSLNTGMTFVAKTIGPALFYSYLKKFGLLDRTDIEFDTEISGNVEYYDDWTESELATKAFGQGLTVNMVQLANAYGALANGGVLMKPHIIEEIRHDDETVTTTEINQIRRVLDEETSSKITTMLINAVEEGVASPAQIENHFIAGKTGTSQTYKWGQALSGPGTTIASFAGYGPINDPQFVIVVKFDHPRKSEWGSLTAAPTFQEIATYLFDYYNIPPDK